MFEPSGSMPAGLNTPEQKPLQLAVGPLIVNTYSWVRQGAHCGGSGDGGRRRAVAVEALTLLFEETQQKMHSLCFDRKYSSRNTHTAFY